MPKKLSRIFCAAICALVLAACGRQEAEAPGTRRVFLMYSAAFSNLSPSIHSNEKQLYEGDDLPFVGSDDVLLIYSHHTSKGGVYNIPTNPILCRAYKDMTGSIRKDTLIVYPDTDISASAETLRKVLTDVQDLFPASNYGLLVSSHGKGWIPPGYKEESPSIFSVDSTKELGQEAVDNSGIDIRDLPGAIPMHLEFFIMDACLMGCVEVAYELKDQCDYIVFSPTEILSYGMIYTPMLQRLLVSGKPDLQAVCEDYMEYYNAQTGSYNSATITLVDCSKLDALAAACAPLTEKYRTAIGKLDRNKVQAYFYNELHWFYDLRDIFAQAGASLTELAQLDAALDECVLYKDATPTFFGLKLLRVCGLSSYIPMPERESLNDYYKTLSWNKATGLIQ